MNVSRRNLLLTTLFGSGCIGLRALATGIPAGILASLTSPRVARAEDPPKASCTKPQYVFLLTSGSGDPLNANVPGTFDDPNIYHTRDTRMVDAAGAGVAMTLGGKAYKAGKTWAGLPAQILSRICFFHHGTYTNSHGDHAKVNRLMGAVQRQEMLVSLLAKHLQPCLNTVQGAPMVLSNNLITYGGAVLPTLSPPSLQRVLQAPTGPLLNLQKIRDTHLDQLNALFKEQGTAAQKQTLDKYALSQTEARSLGQDLLADLGTIKGSTRQDQNTAAAVLFKMNVSPVAVGAYSFGGDNHGDTGLTNETQQHVDSAAALGDLMTKLAKYGLTDSVTIVMQNVFGRTLNIKAHSGNADGRNHNANHHCSVMIGAGFKPSVIGGVKPTANGFDFQATAIDSASGAANDAGDVAYEQTFGSVGKTLGRAVGVDPAVLEEQITKGKVIPAALA
jgi:hypothetical protein